jgi:kynurenine formamidase
MSDAAPSPQVGPGSGNGPRLTTQEFDELFDSLAPWHQGAAVDEAGRLGGQRPADVLAAMRAVRRGEAVSLALALNRTAAPDNRRPALHHMVDLGDVEAPEPTAHKDFLGLDYHGKAVTHLDALCHIGYRGQLFGGVANTEAFSSLGSDWAAVTTLSSGIFVRAVLYDVPRVRGVEWLDPGDAVHREDLVAAEEVLGARVGPGDALLLRSGHQRRRAAVGPWDSDAASAGLHVDAMQLVAERGVSVLGGDGDSDVRPSPVDGVHSPIHALALTALGIVLLDNLDLEELSEACATHGQYDFLLAVAPLVVPRGTGSPVNPIAVL